MFDIFNVPIFGHEEVSDNFATYIMLNMGKDSGKAVDQRRCLGLESWSHSHYRTNPLIQEQLAGFASGSRSAATISTISCAWPTAPIHDSQI